MAWDSPQLGTSSTRIDAGWVADRCPICDEVRAHRVQRVGKSLHISLVPVGSGKLMGYEAICLTCHATHPIDLARFDTLSSECPASLDELIHATQPEGPATPGTDRAEAIRERLAVLGHQVDVHRAHTELSPRGKAAAAAGIGLFVLTVVAVIGGSVLGVARVDRAWLVSIAIASAAMIGGVVFCMADAYPWFLRTRFRPQLRRAFGKLAPSIPELEIALAELPEDNVLAGKHFGAAKLHEWID